MFRRIRTTALDQNDYSPGKRAIILKVFLTFVFRVGKQKRVIKPFNLKTYIILILLHRPEQVLKTCRSVFFFSFRQQMFLYWYHVRVIQILYIAYIRDVKQEYHG